MIHVFYTMIMLSQKKLFFLFVLMIVIGTVKGQYILNGTIVDKETKEPLPGASIAVENTTLGDNADDKGRFSISDIQQERVTLLVSYVGYESISLIHDFKINNTPDLRIRLQSSSMQLQQVEVEARAQGQIRANLLQKRAENIKHVLSSEQISTFPDMNAAEAMQRLPGITLQRDQGEGRFVQLRGTPPELTTFNINGEQIPSPEGDVRYVGMDIVAVDQIEFIEVTKVMTPDMDADGIGGSVNIITKKAEGDKPEIRAALAGGYTNLRGGANYNAQFSYGQRFGKFGFNVNGNFFQNNQGSDNLEYDYAKGPFFGSQEAGRDNYFVQFREYQLRYYDITRTRIGVSPTLDYKFNENSSIYLMGMYNSFIDDETRYRLIYDLDDALSETYYLYGGVEHDVRDRVKRQNLGSLNFGGEHKLGPAFIDYQLAYSHAREDEPDRVEALFDSPGQAIAISFDVSDPDFPVAEFPNPTNAGNATAYDRFELDELRFESSLTTDRNWTPRINIRFPYVLGNGNEGYLKFGGKIRAKDKERDIRSQEFGAYFETSNIYPGTGPELNVLTVDAGFREDNLLNRGYVMQHMPDADLIRDFYEFYPQYFIYDRNATRVSSFGEDYKAKERIYAAYGMFRHDLDRLMILGGLRYERTDINYEGARILLDRARFVGIDTLQDERTHEFLLPQIQLRYNVTEDFNLRGALTYTYSRPNFEDVLPYREQDREEVRFGNPDLRYPSAMNIDFLAEKYIQGGGILSGGFFYKKIDDFIFFFKRFAHEGDPTHYSLVEITKAVNGIKANVYGAELQSQFNFDFLPRPFNRFGLYMNYTYTYSEAFINQRLPANYSAAVVIFGEDDLGEFSNPDQQEKITLPGQARHTVNMALFFDTKKFYARLAANYHDAFLFQLGADRDLDEYTDEAWRLDFTANYGLTSNLRLFTDVVNLLNTPLKFYLGTPDRVRQQEFYSWWARTGIKISF